MAELAEAAELPVQIAVHELVQMEPVPDQTELGSCPNLLRPE